MKHVHTTNSFNFDYHTICQFCSKYNLVIKDWDYVITFKVLAPSYDVIHFLPNLAFDIAWRHNQTGCRFNSVFFLPAGFES